MNSEEIRRRFIEFFKVRKHAIIPSAPLVPTGGDASVLFTTAGMQPLVPYLLGEKHPAGNRLVNVQKCVRTQDIEKVGDNTHDTFFEMLGNWSLGSYWKKEAIEWSYDLLTNKETGFGLDPNRLYVTCFEGDPSTSSGQVSAPRDEESATIWKEIFEKNKIEGERIYFLGASKNWWSAGANGPCGPDTEMFYDLTGKLTSGLTKDEYLKADEEQRVVEIWNDVFMEYEKRDGKVVGKLNQQNVDTGAGLERLAMVLQKVDNVFATDLFAGIMKVIEDNVTESNPQITGGLPSVSTREKRIVADHLRTSVMMLADGVLPSNTDRGYVLRRLLRRAVRYADLIKLAPDGFSKIIDEVISKYQAVYPEVSANKDKVKSEIENEEQKFRKTLRAGLSKLSKVISYNINTSDPILRERISGKEAFDLYQTHGFPVELIIEEATRNNLAVDEEEFKRLLIEHQALSRAGAEQKFKGGLADHSLETIKLHTAHHLILAALQQVLGKEVKQRGSNITSERLRIDFSFARKLTPEELAEVEKIVNEKIKENLKVERHEMSKAEAEKLGAEMEFGAKYGDTVSVYLIGFSSTSKRAFSSEFCGGPHVGTTGEIGSIKIMKEEAVAAGVRRIKATLI